MTWGFIWLMFLLKIPLFGLLSIVWWAVRAEPEPIGDDSGGSDRRAHPHRHGPRRPTRPRGPHGEAAVPSPPRMRTTALRARSFD